MKTSFRHKFIGSMLTLAALGTAYYFVRSFQATPAVAPSRPVGSASAKAARARDFLGSDAARDLVISAAKAAGGRGGLSIINKALPTINPADIPELIKALADLPKNGMMDAMMQMLLEALVKTDPVAVLGLLHYIDDPEMRSDPLHLALQEIANQNPQQALSLLANLAPGDVASNLYENLFAQLATSNLAEATASALALPGGNNRVNALKGVSRALSHSDKQAALDWAVSLPPADANPVLKNLLMNISLNHAPLAASYVSKLTDLSARNEEIPIISANWAVNGHDPAAALNWLNQNVTGVAYDKAVTEIFVQMTRPKQESQTFPDGSRLTSFSPNDPNFTGAVALLAQLTEPDVRETAAAALATNWGKSSVKDALAWAQSLPASDAATRAAALNAVVATWSKNDPAAALNYLQASPDPSLYLPADPAVAQSLAAHDATAALAFANGLPDGDEKGHALNNVLATIAKTDFTTAWSDAAALPASDNPAAIMTNLVGVLVKKDPAQAAGLITQFPAGTAQDNVTSTIAAIWVKQDPQAFTVWLTSLPPGDVRDAAIAQLVSSSQATKNLAGVLEWVNTVSNPQTKAALLQQLNQAGGSGE